MFAGVVVAAGVARAVAVAEAVAKRSPAQEMLNPQMMRMMRLTHLRKTLDRGVKLRNT